MSLPPPFVSAAGSPLRPISGSDQVRFVSPVMSGSRAVRLRRVFLIVWIAIVAAVLYAFLFHRGVVQAEFQQAASVSLLLAGGVYLVAGCLRGFTLVPSTSLVLLGLPFFQPLPLFVLTVVGIAISSASIYRFSAVMGIDEYLERRHAKGVARVRSLLERHELPVIVGWSFFPLAPTDLICYVCGALRVGFWKCILGVCLGEGAICGIYIFLGDSVLRLLQWKG